MYRKPIAALAGALLLLGVVAVPAGTKSGDTIVKSRCTLGAERRVEVTHASNNRTKIEFEVDSNKVGQAWNVRITDNGVVAFSGVKTTAGLSGSFAAHAKVKGATGRTIRPPRTTPASGRALHQRFGLTPGNGRRHPGPHGPGCRARPEPSARVRPSTRSPTRSA